MNFLAVDWTLTSSGSGIISPQFLDPGGGLIHRKTTNFPEQEGNVPIFSGATLTSSGFASKIKTDSASAIMELRRLTGLTWEEIARVFGVSRRSIHFWASGQPLSTNNEERLQNLIQIFRRIHRGTARDTKVALVSPQPCGSIPLDLLAEGQYYEVINLLESGSHPIIRSSIPLSPANKAARIPPSPEILASALQDTIHQETPQGRPAKSFKVNKKRGPAKK